ncbi:hypothetical protein K1719_012053 [Acacia pycnantha]|nr:hypothetical protein K1719_012053 [Acacia pycnantha]
MTKEVLQSENDDILIDGYEPEANHVPSEFNPYHLKVFYGKLFPYPDFFRWMSYGNDNDIFLRFQSFHSAAELENSIKVKCPLKIDIGPVYSVEPTKRHAYCQSGDNVFAPVERANFFMLV